jgi:hypothetical protein
MKKIKVFEKAKFTLRQVEESLNETGPPEHDHPENEGRVPWRMVNKYGTWLRKTDPKCCGFIQICCNLTKRKEKKCIGITYKSKGKSLIN